MKCVCCVCSVASPVVVEAPQNVAVDVLRNVSLACQAIGKPQPTVTWSRFDGRPLGLVNTSNTQSTEHRFNVHDDGSLNIRRMLLLLCPSVCLSVCLLHHVRIAENEPYCHSILFVCLDVCRSFCNLQPTTIDRSQPNLVGRYIPVLGPV